MFRGNFYTEADFFVPTPVYRQSVAPGQSAVFDLSLNWETLPLTQNVLTGGIASVALFYVPYRLIWDEWVNFISLTDGAPVEVPVAATPWPLVFEGNAATAAVTVFGRRAYKLIYNQYYGSSEFGRLYDPVDLDTDVSVKGLRTTDQILGHLIPNVDITEGTYDAPVTGTAPNQVAEVNLNDLRQLMRDSYGRRKADMTGDKYVDAMRRMGVDLNWTVQNAPEFLGTISKEFGPKETRATFTGASGPDTGQAFVRYAESLNLKTGRRFFAEHGIVMGILSVRLMDFTEAAMNAVDSACIRLDTYFQKDNNTGTWFVQAPFIPGTAAAARLPRFQYLHSGQNVIGQRSTTPWVITRESGDLDSQVYPALDLPQTSSLAVPMAVYCRGRSTGPSPVRKNMF